MYEAFVADCPLQYSSPNAPEVRDVLGTLFLSVLAAHKRYAHITTIRTDRVNPERLGMTGVVSEDSVRRALSQFDEAEAVTWLDRHLAPWVLDTDNTVKPLYGKQQEGVQSQEAGKHVSIGLWKLLDGLPRKLWPEFIRGDVAFGTEPIMCEAEERNLHYLAKLKLTSNVKKAINRLIDRGEWVDAGHGFKGAENRIQLTGWTKSRRIIVLKRRIQGEVLITDNQLNLAFIETEDGISKYEYQLLVTSMQDEILTIAQHYRDRGDSENCFDELKNQWGWGGFTTKDLQRCRIISRLAALVCNWWSLYTRLLSPDKRHEAITSRPLMLESVGRKTSHAGQTTVTITSSHAKATVIQAAMRELPAFFKELSRTAEQLAIAEKIALIAKRAYRKILRRT